MDTDIFALISFVLVTTFTPGPNNISSASMGALNGYRGTLSYLLGITTGFFVIMLACAFLSNAFLTLLPFTERYLRWIGAGYILWLAMGTLRANTAITTTEGGAAAFTKGFVLQVFNPKVALYGLTLFSTFLAGISGHIGLPVIFSAVFALTAFAATSIWALGGAVIRTKLKKDSFGKAINVVLALLLIYTAVALSGVMESL